jgi:hypothetical protein
VLAGIRRGRLAELRVDVGLACSAVEPQPDVPTPDRQLSLSIADFTPPDQRQVVGVRSSRGLWITSAAEPKRGDVFLGDADQVATPPPPQCSE